MLKSVPFANAVAVVSAAFFLICSALAYVAPDLTTALVQSWYHNFGLNSVKPVPLSVNSFLLGLISVILVSWIAVYTIVEVYNRLAKSK